MYTTYLTNCHEKCSLLRVECRDDVRMYYKFVYFDCRTHYNIADAVYNWYTCVCSVMIDGQRMYKYIKVRRE